MEELTRFVKRCVVLPLLWENKIAVFFNICFLFLLAGYSKVA